MGGVGVTAIMGMIGPDDRVWLVGDSAAFSPENATCEARLDQKVFRKGDLVIGVSGSFRLGQIMQYCWEPPAVPLLSNLHRYMVAEFIPSLRVALEENGLITEDPANPLPGNILVGTRGYLFEIQPDYQVAIPQEQFWAIGSGAEICIGAMAVLTAGKLPKDLTGKLQEAMRIATRFHAAVLPPFVVVHTNV